MRGFSLALVFGVLVGCGDGGTPAAPDRPGSASDDSAISPEEPGPSTEDGSGPIEPLPTVTNKFVDCHGEDCVHGFAFGTVHYIVFSGAAEDFDPATDAYVDVPGAFDIRFEPRQDGGEPVRAGTGPDGTLYEGFNLPVVLPLGFGFQNYLTLDFQLSDPSGTYPGFECHLELFNSGLLSGAIVREPGVIVCSTHNWDAPQSAEEPGLLIEYALCDGPADSPCIY